jgi:hypothetical protein
VTRAAVLTVAALILFGAFHHAMMADRANLCATDATAFRGC